MSRTGQPEKEYILGTHDDEARRLGFQHRLWSDLAHQTWKSCSIKPGDRVLDVGCGPGFAALDLARIVTSDPGRPGGLVVGVDESPRYIEQARGAAERGGLRGEMVCLVGDVQNLVETLGVAADELRPRGFAGTGFFDLAYTRWVLCFVPDPGAVASGVSRLLKPGGRWGINDYFNYESMALAPRSKAFARVIQAVGASWRSRGGDPDIAGRMPALCRAAGMRVDSIRCDQRVARPGDSMWMWPDTFFRIYVPTLVGHGFLSAPEGEAFFEDWARYSADPDSFMHLPSVYELIAVRV